MENTHHPKKYLISLAIIIILIIILGLASYYLVNKNQQLKVVDQKENSTNDIKIGLLKSGQLSTVTLGIAQGFIPSEKIKLEYGSGSFEFPFYRVKLTKKQYEKFISTLPQKTRTINDEQMDLTSPSWHNYSSNNTYGIYVKELYACINTLCVAGTDTLCIPPKTPEFQCANIYAPAANTVTGAVAFMYGVLNEAGINCPKEGCEVSEVGKYAVSIPQYSKQVIYFENLSLQTIDEYTTAIKKESQESLKSFQLAGWKADIEDITNLEAGWTNAKVPISLKIVASNDKFTCNHTMTIFDFRHVKNNDIQKKEMVQCELKIPEIAK